MSEVKALAKSASTKAKRAYTKAHEIFVVVAPVVKKVCSVLFRIIKKVVYILFWIVSTAVRLIIAFIMFFINLLLIMRAFMPW